MLAAAETATVGFKETAARRNPSGCFRLGTLYAVIPNSADVVVGEVSRAVWPAVSRRLIHTAFFQASQEADAERGQVESVVLFNDSFA
jgi:hypothetical protein